MTGPKWRKRRKKYYDAFAVIKILDDEITKNIDSVSGLIRVRDYSLRF